MLNISDIIEATSDSTREHPSIITYLCEIVYLPDKPASGSDYDILSHKSQEYNMFKEYHVINIAMPRTLTENVPLSSPATTIKDYTNLQTNYSSFDDHDINHNITTILNTYDKPDDDTENTVLSKKVFTDLLFYDNSATKNLTGEHDGYEKIVTGYNINTASNINVIYFSVRSNHYTLIKNLQFISPYSKNLIRKTNLDSISIDAFISNNFLNKFYWK